MEHRSKWWRHGALCAIAGHKREAVRESIQGKGLAVSFHEGEVLRGWDFVMQVREVESLARMFSDIRSGRPWFYRTPDFPAGFGEGEIG